MFEHNDDIISIATHENIVATGQVGSSPLIAIWDCEPDENQ